VARTENRMGKKKFPECLRLEQSFQTKVSLGGVHSSESFWLELFNRAFVLRIEVTWKLSRSMNRSAVKALVELFSRESRFSQQRNSSAIPFSTPQSASTSSNSHSFPEVRCKIFSSSWRDYSGSVTRLSDSSRWPINSCLLGLLSSEFRVPAKAFFTIPQIAALNVITVTIFGVHTSRWMERACAVFQRWKSFHVLVHWSHLRWHRSCASEFNCSDQIIVYRSSRDDSSTTHFEKRATIDWECRRVRNLNDDGW
jgi:hypothetical protein